jgi:uncharacterized flavoprotein (TIGR03862 family)
MNEAPFAVIGGGPAGLIAAETLSAAGARVIVYERMPNVARKLLMAGRGGLNLTHSEAFERFVTRYGAAAAQLRPMLEAFTPASLIAWSNGLGQETFVGSSGRVFPKAMKASPLLRAWLARLSAQGVEIRTRVRWTGWTEDGALAFMRDDGTSERLKPRATLLALGGASWPKLGSDGAWTQVLAQHGVEIAPLRPANMGLEVAWSDVFRERFAGTPLKQIALSFGERTAHGEAMITSYGIEGGAIYALSAALRDALETAGSATLHIDLKPSLDAAALAARLSQTRAGDSLSSMLRKRAGLSPVAIGLLREASSGALPKEPTQLAALIKAASITLTAARGLDRAISSAGGVSWSAVDDALQLKAKPGLYVAGEMLDWEAPTGGYLLQASFATAMWAARAMLRRA